MDLFAEQKQKSTDFEKLMVTKGDARWEGWTAGLGLAYAH